jgi:hypothetical protein
MSTITYQSSFINYIYEGQKKSYGTWFGRHLEC